MDYYQAHEVLERTARDGRADAEVLEACSAVSALLTSASLYATHDPGVAWPGGPHEDPMDAIMATLEREREMHATFTANALATARETSPEELAIMHVDRADDWANRDNVAREDWRRQIVDYNLRLAQIYATLAVAKQISMTPSTLI